MKTFNKKLILPFITTLLLAGCMPDSLTKFKKDPPKKELVVVENPTVPGAGGKPIDTTTLVNPTLFKYVDSKTDEFVTEYIATVGKALTLEASFDGSVSESSKIPYLFVSCAITPSLPAGLTLNNTAGEGGCNISGTPLAVSTDPLSPGDPITYTVTLTYIANGGANGTITSDPLALAVHSAPLAFEYVQNEKTLLKLSATTSKKITTILANTDVDSVYVRGGFVTSNAGVIGVVKYVDNDTSSVGVVKTIPMVVNNHAALALTGGEYPGLDATRQFICTASGKLAKVIRYTSTTGTLYVEMISDTHFVAGDSLGKLTLSTDVCAPGGTVTVSSVNTEYLFKKFGTVFGVDNNIQFYTNYFNVTAVHRAYEVGQVFGTGLPRLTTVTPSVTGIMTVDNAVKYTVSPELPDGLSLNEDTGEITGQFNDKLDPASFTITATNPVGSSSTSLGLSAILAPTDLSYTNRQLIAVKSYAKFIEGETLLQAVTPPLVTSITAQILRKYDSGVPGDNQYKLAIETLNGYFDLGAGLDSGNFYYSEKSYIPLATDNVNYNVAITVASAAPFSVGGYVSTPQGAAGKVVAIEGSTLFIQMLTPGATPVFTPFQERNGVAANSIDNALTYAAPETTITQIEANTLTLELSAVAGNFSTGRDITTDAAGGKLAAYIYDAPTATSVKISQITREPDSANFFKRGQTIYDNEYGTGATTAVIDNVSSDNKFILEAGEYAEIRANITEGNGLTYSVSPALPSGLTLNSKTGLISGTPKVRTTLKSYTLTARNLIDKSEYLIDLEVQNFFKVADGSGSSSFAIHRYGPYKSTRECKINAADILEGSGDTDILDIRCFLEAEEEELHSIKLKLLSSAGAGVCEFIEVQPFSFWRYAPLATDPTVTKVYVKPACVAAGSNGVNAAAVESTPSAAAVCAGNYTLDTVPGPNCDEGYYEQTTYTGTDGNADGDCKDPGEISSTVDTLACNGKKVSCLSGPVTDMFTTTQLTAGYRSQITFAENGATVTNQFSSPASKAYGSNLYVANSSVNNSCTMTNTDADTLETNFYGDDPTVSPFGESSMFYTFNCLTGSKDIKARIRLAVRDWNKSFKINDFIDVDFPGGGVGATLMNNNVFQFGKLNNDYADWDDVYNGAAASYGTCAAGPVELYKYPESEL